MTEGIMTYEYDRDAWVVEINGYQYTLFCGELFELIVGQRNIPSRLELGKDWYIIMEGNVPFDLRICNVYHIYI
ncbi:hypothetical protein GCM10009001_36110 [Virgibacillus siamensis]|uniref:DUF5348 domain-containing protein n=1 Tax=Virgibacillus siamensis TaxID=480071 RepID=A0ABN1GPE8_9BACI